MLLCVGCRSSRPTYCIVYMLIAAALTSLSLCLYNLLFTAFYQNIDYALALRSCLGSETYKNDIVHAIHFIFVILISSSLSFFLVFFSSWKAVSTQMQWNIVRYAIACVCNDLQQQQQQQHLWSVCMCVFSMQSLLYMIRLCCFFVSFFFVFGSSLCISFLLVLLFSKYFFPRISFVPSFPFPFWNALLHSLQHMHFRFSLYFTHFCRWSFLLCSAFRRE